MSKRWGAVALSTLALAAGAVLSALPAAGTASPAAPAVGLTLTSQTQWVTPATPWFSLGVAAGAGAGPAADLHVSVTIFDRIDDASQLTQDLSAAPEGRELARVSMLPVHTLGGVTLASTCITVFAESTTRVPAPGPAGSCPASAPTVTLGCALGGGTCDDVYPVSVELFRTGQSAPVARFTTFLTYEEPGVATVNTGGPLRVALVVPVHNAVDGNSMAADAARTLTEGVVAQLAARRQVATTLDVSPTTAADLLVHGGKHVVSQLASLTGASGPDQLLPSGYAPVDVAALTAAGLGHELSTQLTRGSALLRQSGLTPGTGSWVDTGPLAAADDADLATGLTTVGATQLVVSDTALAPSSSSTNYTFAHPFTLDLGHGDHVTAVAADSQADARFEADPGDPVLGANQLLAQLAFIHFEDEFLSDPRGLALVPPAGWVPSVAFLSTLLDGLGNSQIMRPVTLDQLVSQVAPGGNGDATTRQLGPGAGVGRGGITVAMADQIIGERVNLDSYATATGTHVPVLTTLSDQLLGTESDELTPRARAVALGAYGASFSAVLSQTTLAVASSITFTSRSAFIPISVLSSAPYPIKVVLSLSSDRFTFPGGSTRTLVLSHPTTSVRIEAKARASGDRLPITITLRTPDGGLTVSRAVLTVHATTISIVGIALTVLAGLVLLVWWARTWRRGRRRRPRTTG